MTLLSGLIYRTPFKHITDVKHSKHYQAQARAPEDRTWLGYDIVKLEEDITFTVGWRTDNMKEYHAKKGQYLVQTVMQPPKIYNTWKELQQDFHIFRKKKVTPNKPTINAK